MSHMLSQYTAYTGSLWVKQASLMQSIPNKTDRSLILCCSSNFPKHLSWLNYQLWLLSLFTLYLKRLAVFTSRVKILPFIADKKATSTDFGRNKRPCQCLKLRANVSDKEKEWLGTLDTPLETTLSFTADYILLTLTTQTHELWHNYCWMQNIGETKLCQ